MIPANQIIKLKQMRRVLTIKKQHYFGKPIKTPPTSCGEVGGIKTLLCNYLNKVLKRCTFVILIRVSTAPIQPKIENIIARNKKVDLFILLSVLNNTKLITK